MIEKVYAASPRNVPKPIANAIIGKGSEAVTDLVHATTGVTIRKTSIKDDVNGYFKFILGRFGLGETLVDNGKYIYNINMEVSRSVFADILEVAKGNMDFAEYSKKVDKWLKKLRKETVEQINKNI